MPKKILIADDDQDFVSFLASIEIVTQMNRDSGFSS